MAKYRTALPQLGDQLFLTDGGLETTLIFHDGLTLPHFASFDLMKDEDGRRRLRDYYDRYVRLATARGLGFVLETVTWRANPDWAAKLGYDLDRLADMNRLAVAMMEDVRRVHETRFSPMPISGNIGPRGDGYRADARMTAAEARDYHGWQVGVLAGTRADFLGAFTLNYVEEAIGVALAAKAASTPVVLSFTVETDGRLPSGQGLADAILETDAATGSAPAYYMINCAHPAHFEAVLAAGGGWTRRVRGIRANASMRSHAELDDASELDAGDPVDLGRRFAALRGRLGHLTVLGGCCGTDHRHVAEIARFCTAVDRAA